MRSNASTKMSWSTERGNETIDHQYLRPPSSALEYLVLQLDAVLVRHILHTTLHLILHAAAQTKELSQLKEVKGNVCQCHDRLEYDVSPCIIQPLHPGEVRILVEAAACPFAHHLDAVDGRAQVLIVALDDAHVPAYEDELLGPLVLISKNIANTLLHLLLHIVVSLRRTETFHRLDVILHGGLAALVRLHQCRTRKHVCCLDTPLFCDVDNGLVIKRHEGLPESTVLMAELRRHVHIEAMINQNQLRATVGETSDEDVSRVRIAVDDAPFEDLSRKEVYHGGHDFFSSQAEASSSTNTLPLLALWLDLLLIGLCTKLMADNIHVQRRQGSARSWAAFSVPAQPSRRHGFLVPQSDALYPFRRQDSLRGEVGIHRGDIDTPFQAALRINQLAHGF